MFRDDKQLCRTLIEMFLDNSSTTFKELREAVVKEDSKTINFLAHKLAGAAAILGAASFMESVRVLEDTSKQGNTADNPKLLADIEADFADLKAELNQFLADHDA
jgi:HPt (histidine-containing phosphotransfer) domain-containing protein